MKRVISSCIYLFVGICLQLITGTLGQTQCQLPAHFNQAVWRDSRKGLLTFTSTAMKGWGFRYGAALTEENPTWNCHANSTSGLDTTLVFKSSSTITVLLQQYQPYLCMRLTKITDHSYYYYLAWVEESLLNYERVSSRIASTVISNPLTQLCLNNTQSLLPDHEYHIMIKRGFEINAMQYCPPSFYGVYNYTVKDLDGGQTYCGNGNGRWDVCSDHQGMKFNYTSCSTPIAYSPTGNVFCVYERTGGSNIVFTVYSQDSGTFSCFMASTASDGSLKVSQALGSCTKTQTPTLQPTLSNGTKVGMNMELKPIVLCPITTTSSTTTNTPATVTESSGLSAGAAAGISIGIIALIATAVLFICLYLKCRSKHGQRAPPPAKSSEKGKHTFSVPSFACIAKLCKNGSEPKEPQNGAVSHRSLNSKVDIDKLDHRRYPNWILSHSSTPPMGTVSPSKQRRHLETPSKEYDSNLGRASKPAADGQAPKNTSLEKRVSSSVENRPQTEFETQMKQRYRPIVLMDLETDSGPKMPKQDLEQESKRANTARGEIDQNVKTNGYEKTGDIVNKEATLRPSQSVNKVPSVNQNYNANLLTTDNIPTQSQKGLSTSKTFSPVFSLGLNPIASPISSLPVSYSVSPSVDLDMEADTTIDSPKPTMQPLSRELSRHTIHSRVETVNSTTSATGIRIDNLESLRKSSITPVAVPDSPFEKPSATSREMDSVPDNKAIVKGFFLNKEKRYSSTFLNVKSTITDSPTSISSKEVKERKLVTPIELRKISSKMSDKRRPDSKRKKKTDKNALKHLEWAQSFHKTPNKKGEFYNDNIPILKPHMEAKKIDLDGSISGIAYDDDNVKARQMQNTPLNGDSGRRSVKSVTFRPTSSELRDHCRNAPSQASPILGHASSPHAGKSPYSFQKDKIESGCEYFLENESAVIVLNVKKKRPVSEERVKSVRDDLPSVYEDCEEEDENGDLEDEDEEDDGEEENDDEEEDEDEHDDDDEDDDDDDDDDNENDEDEDQDTDENDNEEEDDANGFHGRKFMTAMKITYGDTNGRGSDPDRMIMSKYGDNFET